MQCEKRERRNLHTTTNTHAQCDAGFLTATKQAEGVVVKLRKSRL